MNTLDAHFEVSEQNTVNNVISTSVVEEIMYKLIFYPEDYENTTKEQLLSILKRNLDGDEYIVTINNTRNF